MHGIAQHFLTVMMPPASGRLPAANNLLQQIKKCYRASCREHWNWRKKEGERKPKPNLAQRAAASGELVVHRNWYNITRISTSETGMVLW